jgi:hypothetical protein
VQAEVEYVPLDRAQLRDQFFEPLHNVVTKDNVVLQDQHMLVPLVECPL